jgi:predicted amidohydrolase
MSAEANHPGNLIVALLQTELIWEHPKANRERIEARIEDLDAGVDLIVLPEMFTTGFSMHPQGLAEHMDGPSIAWLKDISDRKKLSICGSIIIEENGAFFNRFVWFHNGNLLCAYDKRHLFTMAGEHHEYTAGTNSAEFTFKAWRVMPRICYDLRFPVWNRNTAIDLQIYVANWPSPRVEAWYTLLQARAIENQCYVIGVNRVGKDGNDIPYSGYSAVFDSKGNAITPPRNTKEGWIIAELDYVEMAAFRQKFPIQNDADSFQLLP